jgi:L-aspartate oxidase
VPAWQETGLEQEAEPALIWRDMRTIQHAMWHYVGLIRSGKRLARTLRDLHHLKQDIDDSYRATRPNDAQIGLRNSVPAAQIAAEAEHRDRTSRGAQYREDGVNFRPS